MWLVLDRCDRCYIKIIISIKCNLQVSRKNPELSGDTLIEAWKLNHCWKWIMISYVNSSGPESEEGSKEGWNTNIVDWWWKSEIQRKIYSQDKNQLQSKPILEMLLLFPKWSELLLESTVERHSLMSKSSLIWSADI